MVTSSRRGPLVLLAVCVFAAVCTEVLPVGLLPEVGRGLGVSPSAAGLLVSSYAVLVAVMSVPVAALAARWPRRRVLAVLLGAYCVSNLCFATAPDYAVAVAARVIGGVAHAGFFAVAVAAAVSLVDTSRSGQAVAVVMVGNALALVLGVPLGTVLGTALGWRWAFVVLAFGTAALAAAALRVLPDGRAPHATAATPVLVAARRPALLVMSLVIALLALGHFTLYTYASPLLLHDGIPREGVGIVLFGYGCGGLAGLALASAVVTRWPEQALAINCVLMSGSLVLAAVVGSPTGIVAVVVVWGVAFGAVPTLTQTVTLRAAGEATDAATALVNATMNLGIAGGALLGSRLLGAYPVPELGWAGAALVALSLAVYLLRLRAEGGTAQRRGSGSAEEADRAVP
jgi:DHA1 family inner membrane transport protein